MPSTPTTKSQVQAYRFVLRRMQSALVRKDAVMLHDPMRTHMRSVGAGVALAVVGLLGFLIFGIISPRAQPPAAGAVVVSEPSGGVYVAVDNDGMQLIPMTNMASARLLQMQLGADSKSEMEVIGDDVLADIPRGQLTGLIGAPDYMPGSDRRIVPSWGLCDVAELDASHPDAEAVARPETTVLAGVEDMPGTPMTDEQALLVHSAENDRHYLVYRPSGDDGGSRGVVRAPIDVENDPVAAAAVLNSNPTPRAVSLGLLNAIPEVGAFRAPQIPGAGSPLPNPVQLSDQSDAQVGTVAFSETAAGARGYYVLLADGYQRIPEGVADLIRADQDLTVATPGIQSDQLTQMEESENPIDVADLPEQLPTPVSFSESEMSCFTWDGSDGQRIGVTLGDEVVLPKSDEDSDVEMRAVSLSSSPDVDYFFMPPGNAAVVRAATGEEGFERGPLHFVSDRGVIYGIPDMAHVVGLDLAAEGSTVDAGPESILGLLPSGPRLDQEDVSRVYDAVPFDGSGGDRMILGPEAGQAEETESEEDLFGF
ncbi:type VII secretion protein EccB [Actinoalloteichus fjordicus]|uniref:Type VII secretion protein EccB, Actinobacterial n=1 Tax=Actinoalloteichus fjordicus TaxID=1612552 RepID=A0AAC9LIX8_9PSEU|nr:type VII secretion protein EccB [Actinoalloteichus fjordicus]APU17619.1 type VII secretion protein EccB, Actinobacterial [Actinoalloteichus fjordicus]